MLPMETLFDVPRLALGLSKWRVQLWTAAGPGLCERGRFLVYGSGLHLNDPAHLHMLRAEAQSSLPVLCFDCMLRAYDWQGQVQAIGLFDSFVAFVFDVLKHHSHSLTLGSHCRTPSCRDNSDVT